MRTNLLLLMLLFSMEVVLGQKITKTEDQNKVLDKSIFDVSFKNDTIKAEKSSKEQYINIPLRVNINDAKNWEGYKLKLEINPSETSLPASDYKLIDLDFEFKNLKEEEIVNVVLKKDTIEDRNRFLVLNLMTYKDSADVAKRNIGNNKKVVIMVKSLKKKSADLIDDYKILSYVGTNFDIVEGKTKAKNLFFATNIYVPPVKYKNKIGFYFSLYGNRTMSDVDSTGNVRRTYKIESIDENSHMEYTSQNKLITSRVSDNIGVHISPLFRFIKSSNENLNLFYAPSLEFIWRKSTVTREFKNPTNLMSETVPGYFQGTITMDDISRRIQNEYVFNAGLLGLFLVYETKDFSFRVQASTGYSSYFYPSNSFVSDVQASVGRRNDIFFLGRAWITEAKTGLTLQTEIMNTALNPRPFFGITLSKAFKLDKLANIFKPITER